MLEKATIESVLMMYINKSVQQCHLIIIDMAVNYKKQMVIISIKSSIQYSIYQVSPEERENLYKTWALRTYKNTQIQIVIQNTDK